MFNLPQHLVSLPVFCFWLFGCLLACLFVCLFVCLCVCVCVCVLIHVARSFVFFVFNQSLCFIDVVWSVQIVIFLYHSQYLVSNVYHGKCVWQNSFQIFKNYARYKELFFSNCAISIKLSVIIQLRWNVASNFSLSTKEVFSGILAHIIYWFIMRMK